MDWLTNTVVIGTSVAIATTFDDNIYLTAFFGKVNRTFRPRHVIIGEFIGFTTLVVASLPGLLGGLILPAAWVGLLGFLPIAIGTRNLLSREEPMSQAVSSGAPSRDTAPPRKQSLWSTLRDRQTYRVSAVTIANGGNNIGIYVPLFASSSFASVGVIVSICYAAIALWCLLSFCMIRNPLMAPILSRYGQKVFPLVLIWLGFSILQKSGSFDLLSGFGS